MVCCCFYIDIIIKYSYSFSRGARFVLRLYEEELVKKNEQDKLMKNNLLEIRPGPKSVQ